ncbi:zinc metalloproteinase nas-14 [Eucyclogobius newberryi]|uniref:zinc metalloproteinase nas-14 n=1 Tax=Eucyclogobius newberryi TaxID=166745 RepID=UPI003B5C7847
MRNNTKLFFDKVHNILRTLEDSPETVEELQLNNFHTDEGDIIPVTDRNAVEYIWPTRDIPFVINDAISSRRSDIIRATKMISTKTCLTFHERTFETNYLHFKDSLGCASYVGFIGGAQSVFIGSECNVGNIVHELLHALGFYHEHTRLDRDSYISIKSHNIMPGAEKNFVKRAGDTLNVPYDTDSILHYGRLFFSINGLPTILPLHESKNMGQRLRLTESDIKRVRLRYDCGMYCKCRLVI